MVQQIEKIVRGEPIDRSLWDDRMAVYLALINRSIDPSKARRIMDLYVEEN